MNNFYNKTKRNRQGLRPEFNFQFSIFNFQFSLDPKGRFHKAKRLKEFSILPKKEKNRIRVSSNGREQGFETLAVHDHT